MDENVKTSEPDFDELFAKLERSARAADAAQADYYADLEALPAAVQGADRSVSLPGRYGGTFSVSTFRRRGRMPEAVVSTGGAADFSAVEVVPGTPGHLSVEIDRLENLVTRAAGRRRQGTLPPAAERRFVELMLGEIDKAGLSTQIGNDKKNYFDIDDLAYLLRGLKQMDKEAGMAYDAGGSAPRPTVAKNPEAVTEESDAVEDREAPAPSDRVKRIQVYLKDRGLYDGEVDGIWGPMTAAAVLAEEGTP